MLLSGDLSQISIASAHLTLRSFTALDAAESYAEANPRIAEYMSWIPSNSEADYEVTWQKHLSDMRGGKDLQLVIRLTRTNEFIGRAGLHSADADFLETGIWVKESAQGRGFGREAVAAVVKWASETWRPTGFVYPVVDENKLSRRLAEALGGEIIGVRQRQKPGDKVRTLLVYRIPAAIAELRLME